MKTERRHELQKNQLADALGSELDYLRPYYKTIVAVLVAVAAVGITIAVLSSQRSANNAAAWGNFYNVLGDGNSDKMPAKLESIAKSYPGTQAALWSELAAGDLKFQSGSAKMFSDRDDAEKDLAQAKQHFESVMKAAGGQAMLARRAKLGLAQTLEAMNDPEAAQPHYEALAKENPDDAFGLAATERLAQLKRLNDKQWYAWFAKQEPPPPPEDPLKGSGPLGDLPSSNNLNPLSAPGIIGSELEDKTEESPIEFDAPKTAPSEKKEESPSSSTEDRAPADEKAGAPKSDEPAVEAPSNEDKPSETPSEEKK